MRTVNIVFEDEEFKRLTVKKGGQSWREFILGMI